MNKGKFFLVILVAALMVLVGCDATPRPPASPVEGPSEGEAAAPNDQDGDEGMSVAQVVDWLLNHLDVLALVTGLAVSVIDGGVKKARTLAISLMLEAEKVAREDVRLGGPEKMEMVIEQFIAKLPRDAKAILQVWAGFRGQSLDEMVDDLAQRWFDAAVSV